MLQLVNYAIYRMLLLIQQNSTSTLNIEVSIFFNFYPSENAVAGAYPKLTEEKNVSHFYIMQMVVLLHLIQFRCI